MGFSTVAAHIILFGMVISLIVMLIVVFKGFIFTTNDSIINQQNRI